MSDETRSPTSAQDAVSPSQNSGLRALLIQKIQAAVVVHDAATRIVACNPKSCELLGLTEHQMLGRDAMHPDWHFLREDGTRLVPEEYPVSRVSATRRPLRDLSLGIRRPGTGDVAWVLVNADPIADEDGGVQQVVVTFMDLAERQSREERIRGLNVLMEELLKPGPLAGKLRLITDAAVAIFAADFARIWRVGPGDLCEMGCLHARITEGPHVCRNRERCLHLEASSGRYTHLNGEKHRRVPLGSYKIGRVATGEDAKFITNDVLHDPRVHDHAWAEQLGLVAFAGYKLISAEGEPIGVLALFARHAILPDEDALLETLASTTSQVILAAMAEEALRQSEEQFHTIFDSINDAIFVHDLETGAILDVNVSMCEMFRCSRAEACALTVGEISLGTPPYDQAHALELMHKAAAGEPQRFDWHARARDGHLFWVEVNIHRVRIGARDRVLVVARDISERKRAEEERDRLNRALDAKNQELESMIYTASHDLRSPLLNVHGFTGNLVRDFETIRSVLANPNASPGERERLATVLDKEVPEALEFIQSGASKMDALLNGLLRLSRLGRVTLNVQRLDMDHLMAEVIRAMAFQIQKAAATVDLAPLPPCLGDLGQINQVFSNLLGNALKYLEPSRPGRVRVSGREDGKRVVYCVEDNGIGIAVEHQARVFGVFCRVGHSVHGGEGLGLTIVRRIVERHHGKVWLESEPGKGSRFYVALPAAEP